jgi:hypothetical protein
LSLKLSISLLSHKHYTLCMYSHTRNGDEPPKERYSLLLELFVLHEILFRYKEIYFTPKYNRQNYTNFCPEASSYQTKIQRIDVCLSGIPKLCTGGPRTGFFSAEHTSSSFCLTSTVITVTNIVIVAKKLYIGLTKAFRVCFSFVNIPTSSATANCV